MPPENTSFLLKVVALLDCFTLDRPELGVREAARLLNMSTSAIGRLMVTMRQLGILTQNATTRTYTMGPRVLSWAGVYTATLDVRTVALPYMTSLHAGTRETISLYILDGNDRVCVERLESPQSVRIVSRVGMRLPLYAGSAGKVILAFLPEERREAVIATTTFTPLTPRTIVHAEALRPELDKIRKQGYAVSQGEWLLDASGVAAPILDQSGEVTAALTISGPSQRFTEEAIRRYIPIVTQNSNDISRELGYRGK